MPKRWALETSRRELSEYVPFGIVTLLVVEQSGVENRVWFTPSFTVFAAPGSVPRRSTRGVLVGQKQRTVYLLFFFKTFFLFVDDFCNLFFAVVCCKTSLRLWTSMYLGCRRVSVALVASCTMTWHCFVWSPYGIPGTALRCSISVVSL